MFVKVHDGSRYEGVSFACTKQGDVSAFGVCEAHAFPFGGNCHHRCAVMAKSSSTMRRALGGKFVSCTRDLWRGRQPFQYILVQENHNLLRRKSELSTMGQSYLNPELRLKIIVYDSLYASACSVLLLITMET